MRQRKIGGERWPSRTVRIWLHALAEQLLLLPVWLIPVVYVAPPQLQTTLMLMLPLLALCGVAIALRIGPRWLRGLAALPLAAIAALLPLGLNWRGALFTAVAYVAALRGMAAASPQSKASAAMRYGIGVTVYWLGVMIFRHLPEWAPYMTLLTVAGAAALAILLITLNRNSLQRETLSSDARAVTASAKSHNRLFVAIVLLASLAITLIVGGAIGRLLWGLLRSVLAWLFASRGEQEPPAPEPSQKLPQIPQLAAGEEGWFGHVLDVAIYVLAGLAACALAFAAGRALYRHRQAIVRFSGKLLSGISAFLARTGQDQVEADPGFVDEETDVSVSKQMPERRKRDWLRRLVGPRVEKWGDLEDNRERARYLYRDWLRRLARSGYASPPHLTPEEIRQQAVPAADADLVRLYYKARYDRSEISDAELSAVARERGKTT